MMRPADHPALVAEIREKVPDRPGVYLFSAADGQLLYVGKSVHLKRRMLGYFSRDLARFETRLRRMIHAIASYDYRVTDGELEALLLEDALIKERWPVHNTQQREYLEYESLALTEDEYPTGHRIGHEERERYRHVYGPFKDRQFVDELLPVIRHAFLLRSCGDPLPDRACLELDAGRCEGPCVGRVTPETYGVHVEEARAFLEGRESIAVERLEEEMHREAAARRFEKAARLRDRIAFCRRFCHRQRFLRRFARERLRIRDGARSHLFLGGRWLHPDAPTTARSDDPRFVADRGNIVYRWLQRETQSPSRAPERGGAV
ncbi:MAG: GIY-YIG nuclease family protein [Planctomycetes bacterium]|nr:GIY-YIG nuclease family protein [Planctomycetota bacterium]